MAKNLVFGTLALWFLFPPGMPLTSPKNQLYDSPMFLSAYQSNFVSDIQYPENKKLLLLIIDFDDFMCMNCLESFLSFCHSIPSHILNEIAWGILVLNHDYKETRAKTTVKIAQAKLRGFRSAHRIPFPILIDTNHMFHYLTREGSSLIVMDNQARSISRLAFPLKNEEFERIRMLLLNN